MPVEVGVWRVRAGTPERLKVAAVPLERDLEDYIVADPGLLGERLLLIGRQVPTAHGGLIDLLAIDAEGALHVLELKRGVTPREVVAQTLDYGSWVVGLDYAAIVEIHRSFRSDAAFEAAFEEAFGTQPPEEINISHYLTIVAGGVDRATERIVEYLAETHGVPINVAVFHYYAEGEDGLLVRSWLVEDDPTAPKPAPRKATKEPWNGRDWYVAFGVDDGVRTWEEARRYGFVSAGGGAWYSGRIRSLSIDGRVFADIPKVGYVGVGTVIGEAARFDQARVTVEAEEALLSSVPLKGTYDHGKGSDPSDDDSEWIVPVLWQRTVPVDQAIKEPGPSRRSTLRASCAISTRCRCCTTDLESVMVHQTTPKAQGRRKGRGRGQVRRAA